jgi:signal transduction histidine kinase/ligand-binding sensor domain-containing protein/DNA-binding response OmpR family regulator
MKHIKISIFLVFVFNFVSINAETIFFDHLKGENSLSQLSVNSIYQDEFGIIWIGTRYGLNKYDGTKIEVFKHITRDKNSLFGNNIQTVCGDKKGSIYLQCRSGLVVYDMTTLKMNTVTQNDVVAITYGKNSLWVCSNSTVFLYNKQNNQLKEYAKIQLPNIRISCIKESSTGQLYIGTRNNGLMVMDKNKRLTNEIPNIDVVSMFEDSKQNIWVATRRDGLFTLDRSGQMIHLINNPADLNSIPSNFVRSVCEDDFGNYWIGTFNGLCRYNISQNKFTTFSHSESRPSSLGSSSVWCLLKDKQGTIWIGSFFGGIDYFNPEYSFFNFYGVDNGVSQSLSSPIVGKMVEDYQNNLWIGTEGGGLNYLNRKTGEITIYKNLPLGKGVPANTIKALVIDKSNNNLWIGSHLEGLYRLNLNNNQTKVFRNNPNDPNSLKNDYVRGIAMFQNNLYLATHNSVVVFNMETEKSSFLTDNQKFGLENKQIWDIMIDKENYLWFSTASAVYKYDFNKNNLKKYIHNDADSQSISSTYLNTFFQDSKGRIWLGSAGSGVDLYDKKKDNFRSFNSTNSDIIDDYILDIKESIKGYLLIATNKGFSYFDVENNKFFNFLNQSVFPISAINEGGLYVTENGEIYIGSTNGLFSFNENMLNLQPKSFNVVITDLFVNNEQVKPSEDGILQKSISISDNLELKHNQNAISIEFACTNYVKAIQEDVEYSLSGFDKGWIKAEKRRLITYTNLNPGKYILKIRAKQKGDVFAETTLNIRIHSPFYATWYAYLFYILLIAFITYFIVKFYTSSIKLKVSLDYEKKEKEQIEWLNQSKLRFFTNISHEFRTPLTLIISQIESLLQSTSLQNSLYNRMLSIHKNAHRMGKLINELLDFRKQEQGFLQIKASHQDLVGFLTEIVLTFKEYADHRHITLLFTHDEPNIVIWFDTNQMEKVFYNLLSNAFKFTPDGGEISVSITMENKWVNIIVSDNGSGIEEKDLDKIFDRFYQAENGYGNSKHTVGTGIGLALAKGIVESHHGQIHIENMKKGSKFIVSLMFGDEHFTDEQKTAINQLTTNTNTVNSVPDDEFVKQIIESQQLITTQKYSVLLVEDNREILDLLVQIFNPIYHVTTAVNGKDALEKAKNNDFDIIISDVMMPEMSGIEMCSKIKSNLETCHIPVVLLTARTAVEYTIEGFRTGADDYLTKPFDTRLLIARCNNLVNNRKQLQAKFSKQADADVNIIATNSIDQKFLTRAIELVERTLDKSNFDVNEFASEMMMGRTAFFQKLKGITGQTPNEFITNIRLKKSLKLIIEKPELSITDVGYELGFSSPSYFTKCFREVFGVTPAKYRKDNQIL